LTVELLGEKIGHFCFRNIAELDLRNCKIREIDCFKTAFQNSRGRNSFAEFRNLRKLNLDNNILTNIDSLIYIKSLKYLSLNNNKIERLLSTDVPLSKSESEGNLVDTFSKFFLFPQLEELHVGNNAITRIADLGLYRMPLLRFIHLQGNRISRVNFLLVFCYLGSSSVDLTIDFTID
jgi:hypothetical protein